MKILLWAPFGAGTHYWGPGTSAYRLYKNLDNSNIKVTLVHGSELQELFPEVYDKQVRISSLESKGKFSSIKFLLKSLLWIHNNRHEYDVFHGISAFYFTFIPAVYFKYLGGRAFIKITGGNGGFGANSLISKLSGFSKFRLSQSNSIAGYISISSYISNNLIKNGVHKDKVSYIPNGVDCKRFKPISADSKLILRKENNVTNKFTFLYVGGLTYNKRIINVVHSINELKKKGINNIQFIIVGPDRSDGLVEDEIKNLVQDFNLDNFIIRIPHTNEPELYFKLSDVFILVSEMEGMSNSLLEAMASGLPAIVTKISGSEDLIIENENGLFTDGTVESITNNMECFLGTELDIEQFGRNSRSRIVAEYSSETVLEQHIRLFFNAE